ncbi:immunity 52 family protein [Stigmatella hybrida]|uniref:immunity 52 family protein n=1 Tax=Stigmatella hybrida TaxID=394097 RepID=UPI001CDA7459|nr:immunity 52 family protein [Stigmatella hybrida]
MRETYHAGAYWLARHESAEECARRSERFFSILGHCNPGWTRWHETADSFEEARKLRAGTDATAFLKMFGRKRNRIGDGFHFWLWAGDHPDETTTVNVACGSSSPLTTSVCLLKPPKQGPHVERLLSASLLTEVVRALALAWEPEWAIATSDAYSSQGSGRPRPGTFTGWVMYFSGSRGKVPPLPEPVRVEAVEDKGSLVVLTPEKFTVSNPEHVALAGRVHTLLEGKGLLRPLQPMGSKSHE